MRQFTLFNLFFISIFCKFASAQQIVIDGKLDETTWQNAEVFKTFTQIFPDTGEVSKHGTEIRLLTTDKGIYIGFENQQKQRIRTYSGHDQFTSSDFNMVFIDFNGDGNVAYEFVATLGGGIMDGTYSSGNDSNRDWDGNWQVSVHENSDYWYSEFFIPWSVTTYRASSKPKQQIRVYFMRYDTENQAFYAYPDTQRSNRNFTYELEPIQVIAPKKGHFDTKAYINLQKNIKQNSDVKAGFDLSWKPSSNKQLVATINPDFGQIESDELIVNYSTIETLYTDKRPFFTENQSIFDIRGPNNLRMLNTRRIGGIADANTGDRHDITAALKYIQTTALANYGILAAQEKDIGENKGKTFLSGRWQSSSNKVQFGQLLNFVKDPNHDKTAITTNMDAFYNVSDKALLSGNILFSKVKGEQNLQDWGATFTSSYNPHRNWKNSLEISYLGKNLQLNDAGYLARNNLFNANLLSIYDDYKFDKESPWLRWRYYWNANYSKNLNSETLPFENYLSFTATTKGRHLFRIGNIWSSSGVYDLISRGQGSVYLPDRHRLFVYYQSPNSGKYSVNANLSYQQEGLSEWGKKAVLGFRIYPQDSLRLDLSYTYLDSPDWVIGSRDGSINQYSRKLHQINAKIVSRINSKSDFTLNAQWFGIQAVGRNQLLINAAQCCDYSNITTNDFAFSRLAMHTRFRYDFNSSLRFYLAYTRNGSFSAEKNDFNKLLRTSWNNPQRHFITAKLTYSF